MSSQSTNKVVIMEKPTLKCPRCDSCNTKFCYYNNYSLSQPRHFCKACKRYWTRGGTLRNIPVGGGCRKNKRVVKRATPPSNCGCNGISSAATATIKPSVQQPDHTDLTDPLYYTNPLELDFPFSGFNTTRVSSKTVGFDHQAQMINGLGVRFSSGLMVSENYENGFKQIQDVSITTSSSSLFPDNINPILFGSSTNFAPLSTMSSLLASSLGLKDINESPDLMPYEDMQIPGENGVIIGKETKIGGENGFGSNPTQIEQMNSTDHSSLVWTTTNGGAWFDPSVPSLI